MKSKIFSVLLLAAIAIFTLPLQAVSASDDTTEEEEVSLYARAPEGVSVGGTDISGMTVNEARHAVLEALKVYDDETFILSADEETMKVKGKDIGIVPADDNVIKAAVNFGTNGNIIERFTASQDIFSGKGKDFNLRLKGNVKKTEAYLHNNAMKLASAPVNNTVVREGGSFRYVEGKRGVAVDPVESAVVISRFVENDWNEDNNKIELITKMEEPKGTREELMAIKDLLGSCSTDFSSSGHARANNVRNGTSKLNGQVIFPGEEFSVSTNLQSRNAANGYLPAPSYENGTTVDTYGGGVCQISTTLYNAVIRSELEIVTRYPHSMVVSYVKPSMDAAISEGFKDLVFKNNLSSPVYIEGYTSGMTLYFNIFGKEERPAGRKVTYESEVISTTDPGEKFVASADIPAGTMSRQQSAHMGYNSRLWKVVTENGKEVERKIFNNSVYRASPAIYKVGTGTNGTGSAAEIVSAIGSQNKETIQEAMNKYKAEAPAETNTQTQPATQTEQQAPETPQETAQEEGE